jgi:hypothetical protein
MRMLERTIKVMGVFMLDYFLLPTSNKRAIGFFLQVVLVANSLPALNDVTAMEVPDIVAEAAKVCPYA